MRNFCPRYQHRIVATWKFTGDTQNDLQTRLRLGRQPFVVRCALRWWCSPASWAWPDEPLGQQAWTLCQPLGNRLGLENPQRFHGAARLALAGLLVLLWLFRFLVPSICAFVLPAGEIDQAVFDFLTTLWLWISGAVVLAGCRGPHSSRTVRPHVILGPRRGPGPTGRGRAGGQVTAVGTHRRRHVSAHRFAGGPADRLAVAPLSLSDSRQPEAGAGHMATADRLPLGAARVVVRQRPGSLVADSVGDGPARAGRRDLPGGSDWRRPVFGRGLGDVPGRPRCGKRICT